MSSNIENFKAGSQSFSEHLLLPMHVRDLDYADLGHSLSVKLWDEEGSTFMFLQGLVTRLLQFESTTWTSLWQSFLEDVDFFAFELVKHTCWQAYQQRLVTVSAWSRYQVQIHSPVKHDVHDLLFNSSTIPWASMPICPKDQAAAAFTWSSKELGCRLIFGMGWVGMYYPDSSNPQIFSWQTSPNSTTHFWVSTGMLVGNPSEELSHFPLKLGTCPRVRWSAHPSKEEFLWTQPQPKTQTPSWSGCKPITAKGQLPGPAFRRKLLHNLSSRERCRETYTTMAIPPIPPSGKNTRKNKKHTMAIQYSVTFLVLPINKFTYWIGDNHNHNNLPNLKNSWNFSYQPTSKLHPYPLPSERDT